MKKETLVNTIYDILDSYRKNPYQEQFSPIRIVEKIEYFVNNNLPIKMVFPGFHGKVSNPKFVFGDSIDRGEYVAVQHIKSMCEKIIAVYRYGIEFNIIHEGHFYIGKSPMVTSKTSLDNYLLDFRKLIVNFDYMKSYSIYELIPKKMSFSELLDEFWNCYVPSDEELNKLLEQKTYFSLYKAYKKIQTICLQTDPHFNQSGKSTRRKQARVAARNQMKVYFGFGQLIKHFFKDSSYIRLSSLYKDPSLLDYLAINYLPHNHLSTPVFNCLVEYPDGKCDFIKKCVAIEKNFILAEINGLKYFKADPWGSTVSAARTKGPLMSERSESFHPILTG